MTQNKNQFENFTKDATDMARENIEAAIKSGTILTKGCEDLFRSSISACQSAAEKQQKFMQEAMSSKTINDFASAQQKMAQNAIDEMIAQATKFSESAMKVLTDASEPINKQATKAAKKASDSMAA